MKWFTIGWYQHLFSFDGLYSFTGKIRIIKCRIKGHPNGPVWINMSGFEPDMSCKDCGDEL